MRDWRLYLFCAAWALIAIAPAMNLKALAVLVQDRILYAPSFGWSLAVSIAAIRIASSSSRARTMVAAAISAPADCQCGHDCARRALLA